ncbi:hypothetical protein BGX27_006006, partial [Mortierella sp. AM989]
GISFLPPPYYSSIFAQMYFLDSNSEHQIKWRIDMLRSKEKYKEKGNEINSELEMINNTTVSDNIADADSMNDINVSTVIDASADIINCIDE